MTRLLTIDEVCARLSVSRSYAYRLAHQLGRHKMGACHAP